MESNCCKKLHFVDCIPSIIENLRKTLEIVPLQTKTDFYLYAMDGKEIELDPSKKSLIIISGLGGKATIKMLQSIVKKNGMCDFLLSPKHHLYDVRVALKNLGYKMVKETLSTDNGRHYENLLVSIVGKELSPIGSEMWDLSSTYHQAYLKKQITHYELKKADKELALYSSLIECTSKTQRD